MFPKPPRPEPPRRAVATVVARQQARQPVPTVLVVEPAPPAAAPLPVADKPPE